MTRLDVLLAERGDYPSRSAAALGIRAGEVRVGGPDGRVATKPGLEITDGVEVVVAGGPRFVSRGGLKLRNALDAFGLDPAGLRCLDVGASTGGFTDCLLQAGAARVVAVDVGRGQLDWGLRNDERVVAVEGFNARELTGKALAGADPKLAPGDRYDLITVDVSFISLTKVLPALAGVLADDGEILAMVKPQFELGRERVRKGVVADPDDRREALRAVAEAAGRAGLGLRDACTSGLPGPKGNRESFLRLGQGEGGPDREAVILRAEP